MSEKKLNFRRKKTAEPAVKESSKKEQTEKETEENKKGRSLSDSDCKLVVGGTNPPGNDSSEGWGGGLLDEGDVDIT